MIPTARGCDIDATTGSGCETADALDFAPQLALACAAVREYQSACFMGLHWQTVERIR